MKKRLCLMAVWGFVLVLSVWSSAVSAAQSDVVDLNGNWYIWLSNDHDQNFLMSFNTDTDGYPVLALKQDGDILNGTFNGRFGKFLTKGNLRGHDFEISGTLPQGVVTFKGKLEEGKINGIIDAGVHGSCNFRMARE